MSYCEQLIAVNPTVFSSEVKYISSFRYAVVNFDVNNHITLRVLLLDQNQQPLEVRMIELGGSDYAKWGNDDTYLLNFITKQLNLSLTTVTAATAAPVQAVDATNHTVNFVNVIYNNGAIVLPDGYTKDENNNVLDTKGNIVAYEFLKYSTEGVPITFGALEIDASNNPVLPFGAYIDGNGLARDAQGEHIVMVSPSV